MLQILFDMIDYKPLFKANSFLNIYFVVCDGWPLEVSSFLSVFVLLLVLLLLLLTFIHTSVHNKATSQITS